MDRGCQPVAPRRRTKRSHRRQNSCPKVRSQKWGPNRPCCLPRVASGGRGSGWTPRGAEGARVCRPGRCAQRRKNKFPRVFVVWCSSGPAWPEGQRSGCPPTTGQDSKPRPSYPSACPIPRSGRPLCRRSSADGKRTCFWLGFLRFASSWNPERHGRVPIGWGICDQLDASSPTWGGCSKGSSRGWVDEGVLKGF